jgi:hypothetical protein
MANLNSTPPPNSQSLTETRPWIPWDEFIAGCEPESQIPPATPLLDTDALPHYIRCAKCRQRFKDGEPFEVLAWGKQRFAKLKLILTHLTCDYPWSDQP